MAGSIVGSLISAEISNKIMPLVPHREESTDRRAHEVERMISDAPEMWL